MSPLHAPGGGKAVSEVSVHFELLEGEVLARPHLADVVVGQCASPFVHATQDHTQLMLYFLRNTEIVMMPISLSCRGVRN